MAAPGERAEGAGGSADVHLSVRLAHAPGSSSAAAPLRQVLIAGHASIPDVIKAVYRDKARAVGDAAHALR
jgi:hypothetical protein